MLDKLKEFWKTYSRHFKERKISIVFLSILMILVAIIDGVSPLIYGNTIDGITQNNMKYTFGLILLSFILAIIRSIISSIEGRKTACLILSIANKIKSSLFEKTIKMKASKLDIYTKGEIFNRLEDSCNNTVKFCVELSKSLIIIVINTVVPLIFIFRISVNLSVFALMVLPLMFLVTLLFQRVINKIQSEFVKNKDEYTVFVYNSLESIEGIKSFQIEDTAMSGFQRSISNIFYIFKRQQNIGVALRILQDVIIAVFNFIVLYLAASYIMSGKFTVGNLVSFSIYIEILFTAISSIMTFSISYQQNVIDITRILDIEHAPFEVNTLDYKIIDEPIIKIEANHLNFSYSNGKRILKNLNLKINEPGWYSLVGENGCGKSTFFKILEKFYDCEKNMFFINDYDICDIDYNSLRNQIAYVSKKNYVVNGTIRDNLKIVDDNLNDQDFIRALEIVGLYNFIHSLDDGIDTVIGEGALKLSSGQLQKLMIARIVLKQSSVILIDEVTSDLDAVSEQEIVNVIKALSKDKIVISIAHRSSFIIPSDKIFYMHDGFIWESGTHEELMSNCLIYKKMFQSFLN